MKAKNVFKGLVTIILLNIVAFSNAQIQEKQHLLNFGLGLGSSYSVSGFKTTIPPIEASYEVMIKEKISVGGFLGLSGFKSEYNVGTLSSTTKYSYFNIGGLVNYHFVNDETWNVYIGGKLGYTSNSVKDESNFNFGESQNSVNSDAKGSGILFGANVGARYHISEKLAVHSELGYGISLFKMGITYKL